MTGVGLKCLVFSQNVPSEALGPEFLNPPPISRPKIPYAMACQRLEAGTVSSKATSAALVKIAFSGTCLIAICEPNALRALELLTVAACKDLDDPPIAAPRTLTLKRLWFVAEGTTKNIVYAR